MIALPSDAIDGGESTARVQIIHNSADLKAKNVEVKVNGETLIENFAFRTATPFIDVPANADLDLEIIAKEMSRLRKRGYEFVKVSSLVN